MTRPLHAALLALALTLTACIASTAHGQGWPGERNNLSVQSARNFFGLTTSLKWEALQ